MHWKERHDEDEDHLEKRRRLIEIADVHPERIGDNA